MLTWSKSFPFISPTSSSLNERHITRDWRRKNYVFSIKFPIISLMWFYYAVVCLNILWFIKISLKGASISSERQWMYINRRLSLPRRMRGTLLWLTESYTHAEIGCIIMTEIGRNGTSKGKTSNILTKAWATTAWPKFCFWFWEYRGLVVVQISWKYFNR